MDQWTRRDIVKTGLAASVAAALPPELAGRPLPRPGEHGAAPAAGAAGATSRERLLLDFNWRFHLGHADDAAQDFGFGRGEEFAKTGEFMAGPSQAGLRRERLAGGGPAARLGGRAAVRE